MHLEERHGLGGLLGLSIDCIDDTPYVLRQAHWGRPNTGNTCSDYEHNIITSTYISSTILNGRSRIRCVSYILSPVVKKQAI